MKGNLWRIQHLGKNNENDMNLEHIPLYLQIAGYEEMMNIWKCNGSKYYFNNASIREDTKIWKCNKILGISWLFPFVNMNKNIWSFLKFKSDSANEITLTGIFSFIVVGCSFFHSRQTCIHQELLSLQKSASFIMRFVSDISSGTSTLPPLTWNFDCMLLDTTRNLTDWLTDWLADYS